jgi:ABC-type glycerol-3-phosphate transport system substrate-binding protein
MNIGNRNPLVAVTLVAALAAASAALAADQAAPATAATAVTVYISMHYGKKSAAKDMNAMHEKMEKDGWRFADLETNSENGDTEGVWITYVKP